MASYQGIHCLQIKTKFNKIVYKNYKNLFCPFLYIHVNYVQKPDIKCQKWVLNDVHFGIQKRDTLL